MGGAFAGGSARVSPRMCGLEQLQSVTQSGSCVALCSASTGTANWRPKMSWVVVEFLPIFWRVSCRLVISASICLIRSAGSVAAMVVGGECVGRVAWL